MAYSSGRFHVLTHSLSKSGQIVQMEYFPHLAVFEIFAFGHWWIRFVPSVCHTLSLFLASQQALVAYTLAPRSKEGRLLKHFPMVILVPKGDSEDC